MSSENLSNNESKKQKSARKSKDIVPDGLSSTPLPTIEESQSCSLDVELSIEKHDAPIPNQDSVIELEWLNLGVGTSSSNVVESVENTAEYERNMRIQLYQPPKPFKAVIEESKYGLLAPTTYQVSIVEPKIELLSPSMHRAMEEAPNMGILKAADGTEIIVLSDDEEPPLNDINEVYESADELCGANETNVDFPLLLSAIDSHCCTRRMRERETQTPKGKAPKRTGVCIAQFSSRRRTGSLAGTSSDCASSEATQKVKIATQSQNTFKQRQLELHRLRMTVEHKRLELLNLKLTRERDEMLRETILFEKELELKNAQVSKLNEDQISV